LVEELPDELLPPDERLLPADPRELPPDDREPPAVEREPPTDRDCGAEERLGLLRTELEERELGARTPAELRLEEYPPVVPDELERGTITGRWVPIRPELDRGVTSCRDLPLDEPEPMVPELVRGATSFRDPALDELDPMVPELVRGATSCRDPALDELDPTVPEVARRLPEYMVGR
jgi:hypothetical protein